MGKTVQPDRKTIIYTLADPINGEIRYVGKTVKSLKNRLSGHLCAIKKERNHRTNWIKSLLREGSIPMIEILEETTWEQSQDIEIMYISQFRNWGFKLVNSSDGGEGNLGLKRSKESNMKSSLSMRKYSKRVYQYSLEGVAIASYNSPVYASEVIKGRRENIVQCCLFEKKSHKGFIWSYLSPSKIDLTKYEHLPNPGNKTINNTFVQKSKKVIITDLKTGEETIVKSIEEAAKFTGKSNAGICEECQNKRKVRGDYKFKYK